MISLVVLLLSYATVQRDADPDVHIQRKIPPPSMPSWMSALVQRALGCFALSGTAVPVHEGDPIFVVSRVIRGEIFEHEGLAAHTVYIAWLPRPRLAVALQSLQPVCLDRGTRHTGQILEQRTHRPDAGSYDAQSSFKVGVECDWRHVN